MNGKKLSIFLSMTTICLICLGLFAMPVSAASSNRTLTVGISTEPVTLDPHTIATASVISLCSNIYDSLVFVDEELNNTPWLAEKWETPDPLTWIFYLRKNVTFHDGTPFTAEDVKFSIERAKNWEKSGIKSRVRFISNVQIIDDYTVKMSTDKPFPLLARFMYWVPIMSKTYVEKKGNEIQSVQPNGTGRYKLKEWVKGSHFILSANADHFAGLPKITEVKIRPLTNDATRTAALLSGEVALIDYVPVRDAQRIKNNTAFDLLVKPSTRCIYMYMDQEREQSPKIKGDKNPFLDIRVREAISLAINKEALVKYVMNGFAVPANQMYPDTVTGFDPKLPASVHDLDKARALLAKAGYADGFDVTLDTTNDDFTNDEQIAQAIASQLAKAGIRVTINAAPKKIVYGLQGSQKSSFGTSYWTSTMGDAIRFLDSCAHSYDTDKGLGRWNIGRFSNPDSDLLIEQSGQSMDHSFRETAMQKAQQIFLARHGFIPLYFPVNIYGVSKNVLFKPSATTHLLFGRMNWAK